MTRGISVLAAAAALFAAVVGHAPLSAHITVMSPYTFHRDVVPIIEARCGRCHGDGSASGLSLLRYDTARAAIWPIRQMLVSSHMPPWFAEGAFKAPPRITAKELNVLMTWATGGAPEGARVMRETTARASWALGPPDLIVAMPSVFTFTGDQQVQWHEVRLPAAKIGGRVIRAVDLLPGNPAIVRRAEIIARVGNREQVLGLWQPGESPAALEADAAFRVPPRASLVLRVHYRRRDGDPSADLSQVGIYFAKGAAAAIEGLEFTADSSHPHLRQIERGLQAVAIRPISGPPGTLVRLAVLAADGSRKELARLRLQSDWDRRYAFVTPPTLGAGNKIEVSVIPSQAQLWTSLTGEPTGPESPIRVVLEFVNYPN